jgi:ATP adenylyltransferase
MDQLWAPWRLEYVRGEEPAGCVLCAKADTEDDADDAASLVVWRGDSAYVVLNLYPYNNGHLMVVPYRHVADFAELTEAESRECQSLLARAMGVLRAAMGPGGFNIGLNVGAAAGAGIEQHLHWHIVPRWPGDTNFMPVLAETKVMPQHLHSTWQLVRDGFVAANDDES